MFSVSHNIRYRKPSLGCKYRAMAFGLLTDRAQVRHVNRRPATEGTTVDWPAWVPAEVVESLKAGGIERLWAHQAQLADHAVAGEHCAIATPTASGKTLAYLLPVLSATAVVSSRAVAPAGNDDLRTRLGVANHTALYLSPTKALAHDQYMKSRALAPKGWLSTTLDGDSTQAERRFAKEQANYVLTNPDMLHLSILPSHSRYQRFLGGLRYVIVDEAHRYRGVFGSHVANVLRRLRRVCEFYGSHPVFILSSATATGITKWGARLIAEQAPIAVVDEDTSPHGERVDVLWQPIDTPAHEAADLMAELVRDGMQVLTFTPSRSQAELVALRAGRKAPGIASYRAGFLADERRGIEKALSEGELCGVAATNALELGIDIAGLDAVLISGFPGTLASYRQQTGRAGRKNRPALSVLLAKEDPLDAYLFENPSLLFDKPTETCIFDPYNTHVLGPHIAAAAQEVPLTEDDRRYFGPTMASLADQAAEAGLLRKRPTGWYWVRPDRAVDSISLRGSGNRQINIVDEASGAVIGTADASTADRTVHKGAVYLHKGEHWLVSEYSPQESTALVHAGDPSYYTQAKSVSDLRICTRDEEHKFGHGLLGHGEVEIASQVVAYLRRDSSSSEVWDETPLQLPVRTYCTHAVWWTVPEEFCEGLGLKPQELACAAHAAEHTSIGLLPAFATCDRWDIGGLSTLCHPDTNALTVFVHDGAPGGAGFAEYGYQIADEWLNATLERLKNCPCAAGCPSCIVSPKCGNANQTLDKQAAIVLLSNYLS